MKKEEFLNPKSMLTPGIAGGVVMLITNSLINQFTLSGPVIALILSFLVGALVFLAKAIPLWQRGIYYVLNSLIIFATATGTAFVGQKAQGAPEPSTAVAPVAAVIDVPLATNTTASPHVGTNVIRTNLALMPVTKVSLKTLDPKPRFFKKW